MEISNIYYELSMGVIWVVHIGFKELVFLTFKLTKNSRAASIQMIKNSNKVELKSGL